MFFNHKRTYFSSSTNNMHHSMKILRHLEKLPKFCVLQFIFYFCVLNICLPSQIPSPVFTSSLSLKSVKYKFYNFVFAWEDFMTPFGIGILKKRNFSCNSIKTIGVALFFVSWYYFVVKLSSLVFDLLYFIYLPFWQTMV